MSKKNTTKIKSLCKSKCTCDVNQNLCKLHCKLKLNLKCKTKKCASLASSSKIAMQDGSLLNKDKKTIKNKSSQNTTLGKKGILKNNSIKEVKKAKNKTCKQNQSFAEKALEYYNITKDLIAKQNTIYNDGVMRYGFDRQKLPAILSLQPKVKTDESTPETRLWRAVVMQAMFDIASVAKRGSCKAAKFSAEQWIDLSNPNFILVCRLALLDPVLVYNRSRSVVSLRDLELFFKNC